MRLSGKLILFGIFLAAGCKMQGETYVTLQHVSIDRCASAWFITRFVDSEAKFVFFSQGEKPPPGIGFGFYGATYFNHGPDCTFTDLVKKNQKQSNTALQRINIIVNDVMSWMQGPGSMSAQLNNHIADLQAAAKSDSLVLTSVFPTFDLLYWKCGGEGNALLDKQRSNCHDLLELTLLSRLLNEHGKQKIYAMLIADRLTSSPVTASAVSTVKDGMLRKEGTRSVEKSSELEPLILALNDQASTKPASGEKWIQTVLCGGVQTNALNELYDLRMISESPNDLDHKAFLFERVLWNFNANKLQ